MVSFVQIDLNQTKSKIVYETKPQSYPLPTIKAIYRLIVRLQPLGECGLLPSPSVANKV